MAAEANLFPWPISRRNLFVVGNISVTGKTGYVFIEMSFVRNLNQFNFFNLNLFEQILMA
jgi:hypothetical protein